MDVPFNRPYVSGGELRYIGEAVASGRFGGNGLFGGKCERWLEANTGCSRALMTPSGTAALEMAALLLDLGPGDEVILPSFTFSSTANAIVLRGATPVFVDIRVDTLNLDERLVEAAVNERTRAIMAVHYGGVACEMSALAAIASRHGLTLIEDAAQAIGSRYEGRPLGSFGALAALSFHETKNIVCGEGGALLVNDMAFTARAEIMRDKGTSRAQFFRGQVDKYTWVDIGSSFLPNDLTCAFLWGQLDGADRIQAARLGSWQRYHECLEPLERAGHVRRPVVPSNCRHNAHTYYLLMSNLEERTRAIAELAAQGIHAVFHYVPLHSSPAGRRFGRTAGDLPVTDRASDTLLRLPLWTGMCEEHLDHVITALLRVVHARH